MSLTFSYFFLLLAKQKGKQLLLPVVFSYNVSSLTSKIWRGLIFPLIALCVARLLLTFLSLCT